MERVTFVVEGSGSRIDCLLNPETLSVTRAAGVRPRTTPGGRVTGVGLADEPLQLTGGGRTQLELDLLFDVDLVTTPGAARDVRAMTRPLWQLAENSTVEHGRHRPPLVRFVWGKSWNVPGLVTAVAERFDRFDLTGVPLRSWLRLRFLRVAPSAAEAQEEADAMVAEAAARRAEQALATLPPGTDPTSAVVVVGQGASTGPPSAPPVRFDLLATDGLGSPFLWRLLAEYNEVADPFNTPSGTVLAVPPVVSSPPAAPIGGDASFKVGP